MEKITFEQLVALAAIVLILVGAYNTCMTAIKNHREEKKRKDAPVNALESRLDEHDEKLTNHEDKLKNDHKRLNDLEESNRIIMRALMAMLSHEINGNSDEKLKASFDEIQQFLIEK